MPTHIEWCDESWNPVTGCTPISAGCQNCYAKRMATRLRGRFGYPADDPFAVTLHGNCLSRKDSPVHWRKPRVVFVVSMGDLFHEHVHDEWITSVFAIMDLAPQHTYLLLTKRAKRMQYELDAWADVRGGANPNWWAGVSIEDQVTADERIPILLKTPAAHRFVSCEPLLGPVWLPASTISRLVARDSADIVGDQIDAVICGGESGPGARPMHPDWARSLRDQCAAAGVPYFLKQRGEYLDLPKRSTSSCGMVRVGKHAAGRLLDGREHNDLPWRIQP